MKATVITDIAHVVAGFIASLNPIVSISVTACFLMYQAIDLLKNYEQPNETLMDIVEYIIGLLAGTILGVILL